MVMWENASATASPGNGTHWAIFLFGFALAIISLVKLWMELLIGIATQNCPMATGQLTNWAMIALIGLTIVFWEFRLEAGYAFIHR